jgi:hypothetical protein
MTTLTLKKQVSSFVTEKLLIIDLIQGKLSSYFIDLEGHLLDVEETILEYQFSWDDRNHDILLFIKDIDLRMYDNITWYNN